MAYFNNSWYRGPRRVYCRHRGRLTKVLGMVNGWIEMLPFQKPTTICSFQGLVLKNLQPALVAWCWLTRIPDALKALFPRLALLVRLFYRPSLLVLTFLSLIVLRSWRQ